MAINNKPDFNPQTVTGAFFRYVAKTIPLAFDESMSYYECLCALRDYINQYVDSVNNVNNAMVEFEEYINNYFDNLDVQEEINNKLDEMAESGELENIIAEFLNSNAIMAFNTKSEMINSELLVNGSIAKTLGNSSYINGDGSFYKIRDIVNTDVVDNDNITRLVNSETLIAEKIPFSNNASIQQQITTNTNRLSLLDNRKVIMIGDSYANRTNSWQDRVKAYAGLTNNNCVLNRKSATGLIATSDNVNFITMLTDNVTFNPNEVTDIICCGGMNDRFHTTTEVSTALQTFITTAKTTYPNANIYMGFISWVSPEFENYETTIGTLTNLCNLWKNAAVYGDKVHYMNNVEYSLHDIADIDDSHAHPTDIGQVALAQNIMKCWQTGSCDVENSSVFGITANTSGNITAVSAQFLGFISNGISYMKSNQVTSITFDANSFSLGSTKIEIGTLKGGFLMGKGYTCATTVNVVLNTTNHGYMKVPCTIFLSNGKLYIKFQVTETSGWVSDRVTQCQINEFELMGSSMQQY